MPQDKLWMVIVACGSGLSTAIAVLAGVIVKLWIELKAERANFINEKDERRKDHDTSGQALGALQTKLSTMTDLLSDLVKNKEEADSRYTGPDRRRRPHD